MQRDKNATSNEAELRVFITNCVHSVEQLEILLCLFRSEVPRTLDEIVQKLRNHPDSCQRRLAELVASGLVAPTGDVAPKFVFRADSSLRPIVEVLADAYASRRHWVIDAIYAPVLSGLESFAESFKVRRDP